MIKGQLASAIGPLWMAFVPLTGVCIAATGKGPLALMALGVPAMVAGALVAQAPAAMFPYSEVWLEGPRLVCWGALSRQVIDVSTVVFVDAVSSQSKTAALAAVRVWTVSGGRTGCHVLGWFKPSDALVVQQAILDNPARSDEARVKARLPGWWAGGGARNAAFWGVAHASVVGLVTGNVAFASLFGVGAIALFTLLSLGVHVPGRRDICETDLEAMPRRWPYRKQVEALRAWFDSGKKLREPVDYRH